MKHATVVLAAALLAGCATTAKFEAKMNGFVGQPEGVIVGTYGPPNAAYALADGSRVIQYTRGSQVMLPGATTYQPVTGRTTGNVTLTQGSSMTTGTYSQQTTAMVPVQQPGTQLTMFCTVNFTIDSGGVVRSWNANGNRCVAD